VVEVVQRGSAAVEDDRRPEFWIQGGKGERAGSTPAKADRANMVRIDILALAQEGVRVAQLVLLVIWDARDTSLQGVEHPLPVLTVGKPSSAVALAKTRGQSQVVVPGHQAGDVLDEIGEAKNLVDDDHRPKRSRSDRLRQVGGDQLASAWKLHVHRLDVGAQSFRFTDETGIEPELIQQRNGGCSPPRPNDDALNELAPGDLARAELLRQLEQ